MHSGLLPSTTLVEFYRFALLLTGNLQAAEGALSSALVEGERRMGDLRDPTHRAAWLAARLRQCCLAASPEDPKTPRLIREETPGGSPQPELLQIEAYILAQHFKELPEPERSALALFYLELFAVEQIAEILEIDLERLGGLLARGRDQLQRSLSASTAPQN